MKNLKHIGLLLLFISNFTIAQDVICDDFTDIDSYPEASFDAEELLGYSQGGTQPITSGIGTFGYINGSEPGIYAVGPVDFSFDGTNQTARFLVYGFDYQFDEMGFSVNGSATTYLDGTFPMTVSGVEVDLDLSPEDVGDWEYFYLTFTGEIDEIQHELFESAILELCVESLFEEEDCDNFMNPDLWTYDGEYDEGDLLGNTQGGIYPVTCTDGHGWLNNGGDITGIIIGEGTVEFEFSGANQHARFKIYHTEPSEEYGFSVNGGTTYYINDIFPLVTGGVIVDLDTSPEDDIDLGQVSYLSFSGELSTIEHIAIESGIMELCVEPIFEEGECDNFYDADEWYVSPEYNEGDVLGYTQDDTYPVTCTDGHGTMNTFGETGIVIGEGSVEFAMSGVNQHARFTIYHTGLTTDFGFSANGATYTYLDATFPIIVDGITIDLDTSPEDPDIDDDIWGELSYLSFTGAVSTIEFTALECGIVELCVEPLFEESDCDDFSSIPDYPEMTWLPDDIDVGGVIGTTQGGLYDITFGSDIGGSCYLNNYDEFEGIFSWCGPIDFAFSGVDQVARFKIYYWDGSEGILGFSVNGSSEFFIDDTFPMTVDGVEVDLDTSPDDIYGDWNVAYVTFEGALTVVTHTPVETGILELCVEIIFDEDDCDDFMMAPWPEESPTYSEGDIVGYTQGGTQPIIPEEFGSAVFGTVMPGLQVMGPVSFHFDGSSKTARFNVFGYPSQYDITGFSVNGSTVHFMDETFPMTIDGVLVDMDTSAVNLDFYFGWVNDYLIFTGDLDKVTIYGSETGITELCVSAPPTLVPCDDFTAEPWPMDEIFEPGEVIGYTQDATFPVTVGATGAVYVNTDPVYFPGLFINNAPLIFEFDGSDQTVQFEIYEWFGAGSEGFELNGEALTLFDDTYPMTIDGVEIDIAFTGLPVGTAELAHITFSGELDEIVMVGGELGVIGICYESDSTILVGAGLNDEKKSLISVYPNPADEFISISSNDPIQDIRIYTIAGALVYTLPNINKNQVTLDTEKLEQGLYLVEMFLSDGRRVIEKVILE